MYYLAVLNVSSGLVSYHGGRLDRLAAVDVQRQAEYRDGLPCWTEAKANGFHPSSPACYTAAARACHGSVSNV